MIRRHASWLVLMVVLVIGSAPVRASSLPVIQGHVSGIEVCPQSWCGVAIFAALFTGQVGANLHAVGTVSVAVTHEPLPGVGDCADITSGTWQLQLLSGRTFKGIVTEGELCNPRGDNTFDVTVDMMLTSGGWGTLSFVGILNHNTPIPSWSGDISQ